MKNKKESLKTISTDELEKDLAKTREELRTLRFKSEGARSKNVKEVLNVRRQIARLLTEINAR